MIEQFLNFSFFFFLNIFYRLNVPKYICVKSWMKNVWLLALFGSFWDDEQKREREEEGGGNKKLVIK